MKIIDDNIMNTSDKVKYTGADDDQVKWGSNDDPREVLTLNEIYTVSYVEVHSWHTKISLEGFPDLKFNNVSFEKV